MKKIVSVRIEEDLVKEARKRKINLGRLLNELLRSIIKGNKEKEE